MAIIDWLVLPTIVFAQFAGTSLWFAPNAVISQVGFDQDQVAALVSCVQAGFILGTLTLTYFTVADRFSPPALFVLMTFAGAVLNAICIFTSSFPVWAFLRTVIGFTLAGVYPVGMKIAAQEYPSGLGARLGVLVGALTLGTAFPWLVRGVGDSAGLPYEGTIAAVSVLASVGAASMALVMIPRQGGPGAACLRAILACCYDNERQEDSGKTSEHEGNKFTHSEGGCVTGSSVNVDIDIGQSIGKSDIAVPVIEKQDTFNQEADPNLSKGERQGQKQLMGIQALRAILADSGFRAAAIGYFGHMFELYAFWAYVPNLIDSHANEHGIVLGNVALTSFATIAVGAVSCALAGLWSLRAGRDILPGSAVAAEVALLISLVCCLLAPAYQYMSQGVFLFYLLVWGSAVVADSAQFSSLCAMYACPSLVGTALTLTTCVGFAITIISIQLIGALLKQGWSPGNALALLAIGPVIGTARSYKEWPLHKLCAGGE